MDSDKITMNSVFEKRYTSKTRSLLIIATLVAASAFTFAQPEGQTASETIAQALQDIRTEDSELRRGGVMLLGKYPQEPGVIDALVDSLQDTEVSVRRAAAVSIVRHTMLLNNSQALDTLKALDDEDKEVRLSIATWLPQIILRAQSVRPGNQPKHTEVSTLVASALSDEEPQIRRKVVKSIQYLTIRIREEHLIPIFSDPSPQVRLEAYPILKRLLPPSTFAEAALANFPTSDHMSRLALVETASTQPMVGMTPLLLRLAKDQDPEIQMLAATGLFLIDPTKGAPPSLIAALESDSLDQVLCIKILQAIRNTPPQARKDVLDLLLQSERPNIRGQALALRLKELRTPPPPGTFEGFLNDPAPEIRQQTLNTIQSRPHLIRPAVIISLPDNPYLDVRQRTLALLKYIDRDAQIRTLLRLLIDPEPNIRSASLPRIAQLRPKNWQTLFTASLRDPSPRVRQVAARILLLSLGEEGVTIAKTYSDAHPDKNISRYIRQELSRLKK